MRQIKSISLKKKGTLLKELRFFLALQLRLIEDSMYFEFSIHLFALSFYQGHYNAIISRGMS